MLLTARYVLPVSYPHIEHGAVLVHDGLIEDVGPKDRLLELYPDEEIRDFGCSALLPGFIDLHTHLEFSALRGLVDDLPYSQWKIALSRRESVLSEADWDDAAQLGALEATQSGITTIADITDTGASARAVAMAGLRGVIYREVSTRRKSDVPGVIAEARADIAQWCGEYPAELLAPGIAPHSTYTCSPALYAAVAEVAHEDGLPVAAHLAGSRDEYDFVKYGSSPLATELFTETGWPESPWLPTGVSPVEYVLQWGLFDVPQVMGIHCVQVDDQDVEILAEHDVAVATCPRCAAKLAMGNAPLEAFFEHGLRVGLGTDSPASNNTIDFFDEMRIGLLLQRAAGRDSHFYPAERFVRMATIEGARALHMDDRVGSLEPGKSADVIAVDLSHSYQQPIRNPYSALVHTCNQEDVLFTMVAGRVLYDAGTYQTLDSERILARADEIRTRIRD